VQSTSQRLSGHYASIYPSQHDANLVLSALRHQRDLFSGGSTLGIPDVNTHVGSVIHAFETLAQQRQQLEDGGGIYESSKSASHSSTAGRKESMHKIILPPPPTSNNNNSSNRTVGTLTDPIKHIVRHRPKGKAPEIPTSSNTASATTQTTKFSGDENESSNLDSLNLDEDYRKHSPTKSQNKFPQSYIRNYKVLPPFVPPRQPPSKIPVGKVSNQQQSRNHHRQASDSLLMSSKGRTDVYLSKPSGKYSEDDIENDFLRGSTVSQSFIKNVVRKSPTTRNISTYEQNFLIGNDSAGNGKRKSLERNSQPSHQRSRSTPSKVERPLIDEVSLRYKEYNSNKNSTSNDPSSLRNNARLHNNFQPRSIDRAEL